MKSFIYGSLLLTLFLGLAAGEEFDVKLYGQYRIKALSYTVPQLRLTSNLTSDTYHRDNYIGESTDYDKTDKQLGLTTTFWLGHYAESEARTISSGLKAFLRNREYKRNYSYTHEVSNHQNSLDYYLDADYTGSWYFKDTNRYLGLASSFYFHSQSSSSVYKDTDASNEYYEERKNHFRSQVHALTFSCGSGRIREVTSVHRALLLIDRLKASHPELGQINESGVIEIARTLESRKKFSALHYRYNKYFWGALESVFDSLGYNIADMDMYTSLYVNEALSLLHYQRYWGSKWNLGLKVEYEKNSQSDAQYEQDGTVLNDGSDWNESIFVLVNPSYSWYQPESFQSQLHFNLGLSAGPGVDPTPQYTQKYAVNSTLGYQYDVTDKIMISSQLEYHYSRWNGKNDLYRHDLFFNPDLKYYILDFAYIDIGYTYRLMSDKQLETDLPANPVSHDNQLMITFTFGPSSPNVHVN